MKDYALITVLLLMVCTAFHSELESAESKAGISWQTDYKKALQTSKSTSLPILLFFTGSDWCGWCKKLEKEVLNTPEFSQLAGDKIIFVMLDYPMKKNLETKTHKQNQALKKKYSIKSYPTIVLINGNEELIGTTGYRSGGGQKYAQHLMKMIQEFTGYKQKMKRLALQNFSGKELKRLYQKAHELGHEKDADLLVQAGINSDQPHFFLAERYRSLITSSNRQSEEAAEIKQRLLACDPENSRLTHYQIAVAEFEALSEALESGNINADIAVTPLVNYVNQFQENDRDNVWRLNMVISQVYLDKDQLAKALKYAQSSYSSAPSSVKQEISQTVKKIQSQIPEVN